jgi:hypothetical protein
MKCFEKDIKKHFNQAALTALVNYDFKEIKKKTTTTKQTNKQNETQFLCNRVRLPKSSPL